MGLKYYDYIKYAPLSGLLRKDNINTENQLMDFSNSSWQDCSYNVRSTGEYIIFIKVGQLTMEHMFQEQLLNQVHKLSTMQHTLQERI